VSYKPQSPDEILWEDVFQLHLRHGVSNKVAAANADYVTYGKTMNNPPPKPNRHAPGKQPGKKGE